MKHTIPARIYFSTGDVGEMALFSVLDGFALTRPRDRAGVFSGADFVTVVRIGECDGEQIYVETTPRLA